MPRNLVICLDGTAGQVRGPGDSNSVRVWELLDHSDPTRQLAYYDPGVGTFASPGAWTGFARWISRTGGLIWGAGLRQNLGEVYVWLMQNWQPGDRIFVFGFSRGAFTARALVGMLRLIGLMTPGSENQLQYAVAAYARAGGEKTIPWDEIHRFSGLFAQQVDGRSTIPVTYLGVWDTVKAMGLARRAPKWPFTRSLPNVQRIRHAVAIDETRRPFVEYLVESERPESLEEVWFAGVHSDVGGTFPDDPRLSTIALTWMLRGAVDEGLLIDERKAEKAFDALDASAATATAHRNGRIWSLLFPRRRPIPEGAVLHASVRERIAALPDYRPSLPSTHTWADEEWASPWGADRHEASMEAPAFEEPLPEPVGAEPPTAEPPTAEPPTAEPPTAEPPAAEPPTAEPPTAEPPLFESAPDPVVAPPSPGGRHPHTSSKPPTAGAEPPTGEPPGAEPPTAEPTPVDAAEPSDEQPAPEPRLLQARVGAVGAASADMRLHPSATAVDVFIGPVEAMALRASILSDRALNLGEDESATVTVVLAPLVPMGDPVEVDLGVPRAGRSADARLVWMLPETGLVEARLLLMHDNRVLQTARLRGRIGGTPEMLERIVLWDDAAPVARRESYDLSLVLNHAVDESPRVVSRTARATTVDSFDDVGPTTELLRARLLKATHLMGESAKAEEERRRILVDVAVAGRELHDLLAQRIDGFDEAQRIQIVSTQSGRFLPIELVYGRFAPDPDAALCANWIAGDPCGACFSGPDDTSIVCPSEFWGMARTIERQKSAPGGSSRPPHAPRRTRRDLTITRSLVGASAKVQPKYLTPTLTALGLEKAVATWDDWGQQLQTAPADLLVLLPHNETGDHALEISGALLEKGRMKPLYITGASAASGAVAATPVAVLFGCDTDGSDEDPAGWAGLFLHHGAAVVFSTLTMLHARHAASMTERLTAMLLDPARDGEPLGKLVSEFRREAVRAGLLSALAVTAYGDGDWTV
ncbi:DUF2235 domain-containing protein [Planococcus sp. APC 4015]|nr:DUF2235 domain-containing protein [Planococcus sp. APC 4015]